MGQALLVLLRLHVPLEVVVFGGKAVLLNLAVSGQFVEQSLRALV